MGGHPRRGRPRRMQGWGGGGGGKRKRRPPARRGAWLADPPAIATSVSMPRALSRGGCGRSRVCKTPLNGGALARAPAGQRHRASGPPSRVAGRWAGGHATRRGGSGTRVPPPRRRRAARGRATPRAAAAEGRTCPPRGRPTARRRAAPTAATAGGRGRVCQRVAAWVARRPRGRHPAVPRAPDASTARDSRARRPPAPPARCWPRPRGGAPLALAPPHPAACPPLGLTWCVGAGLVWRSCAGCWSDPGEQRSTLRRPSTTNAFSAVRWAPHGTRRGRCGRAVADLRAASV